MKISVIIPSYKPQNYVFSCLESLSKQTLDPDKWELIFILNGCNKPYYDDIYLFCKKNIKNFIIFQTDLGDVSNARNIGIDNASGEFITFIDDDDKISERYLEIMESYSSESCVQIASIIKFKDEDDIINEGSRQYEFVKPIGLYSTSKNDIHIYKKYLEGPWAKLFPRKIINNYRFEVNIKRAEDTIFNFLISYKINEIRFLSDDALYFRRIRKNSVSSNLTLRNELLRSIHLILFCTRYFFKQPKEYSWKLYKDRIKGALASSFHRIFDNN